MPQAVRTAPFQPTLMSLALGFFAAGLHQAAMAAEAPAQAPVVVVGTAVLPGVGTPLNQVPANVQTLKGDELDSRRALNLSAALNQGAGSVTVNDTAGNPFQVDVAFRGFTASPSLGTPQGLSVFVDGVRVNEVFGDTVNWDLVPESAIARITVIPGSNPVFGLNTLGGALNVTTKSGLSHPGSSVQVYGGSFGRRAAEFETGGRSGEHGDYFLTGNSFRDRGWGRHNPSEVRQLFGKTGYHDDDTDVDLSLTLADNRMEGNQTLPLSMMDDIRQSYSWPDFHSNRIAFVNLKASRQLTRQLLLEGNVYYRQVETGVLNSNVNNEFDTTAPAGPGNQPTGNATNQINQRRPGVALQLSSKAPLDGHRNQWVLGASLDAGRTEFTQGEQEAGSSRDTHSNAPVVTTTSLHSQANAAGLYATDTYGLNEQTYLTVSGRYNHATVKLVDQLGTALNGDHRFNRLNPALGLAYNPSASITTYASYNEGMRVPTPVELSCADPNAPCSLPNAFASDPPLRPVISRTVELGARGRLGAAWSWSAAAFRTRLQDDIQFISSGGGATSAGYFQNVGLTQRQGFELGLAGKAGAFSLSANYSHVDATYQSALTLNSPSNSTARPISCASCTDILVQPGNRMPGTPRHVLKLRGEYAPSAAWSVALQMQAQSSQYARGDENNQDVNGALPGFALFNLDARWRLGQGWEAFVKVDNLFDRRHANFGTLGQNLFTGPGNSFDFTGTQWRNEQFRTVGVPRGLWLGVNLQFGDAARGS